MQALGPVDPAVLTTAEYFVTVHLGALKPSLAVEYPPTNAAVVEQVADEVSPLLRRLDPGREGAVVWATVGEVRRRRYGVRTSVSW